MVYGPTVLRATCRSLALSLRPQADATRTLTSNRMRPPSMKKLIMPPFEMKSGDSPAVSTGREAAAPMTCCARPSAPLGTKTTATGATPRLRRGSVHDNRMAVSRSALHGPVEHLGRTDRRRSRNPEGIDGCSTNRAATSRNSRSCEERRLDFIFELLLSGGRAVSRARQTERRRPQVGRTGLETTSAQNRHVTCASTVAR